MKYLVVIFIIVILFFILKNNTYEKFNDDLNSPEIIEIVKKGTVANVKFQNQSAKSRKFMIFYIDTESPNLGIWVEKEVSCDKKICEIELDQLTGKRYHLLIVETDGKNMSSINRIVKFSDSSPFTPNKISPSESPIEPVVQPPMLSSAINPDAEVFTKQTEEDTATESPSPYIRCGRNPEVKYVETKADMEDIEIKSRCEEDKDIERIKRKVDRNLWDEFKKGYLTLNFELSEQK